MSKFSKAYKRLEKFYPNFHTYFETKVDDRKMIIHGMNRDSGKMMMIQLFDNGSICDYAEVGEQPQNEYYLFGGKACDTFVWEGMARLLYEMEEDLIGEVYMHKPSTPNVELLNRVNGWQSHALISEDEYMILEFGHEHLSTLFNRELKKELTEEQFRELQDKTDPELDTCYSHDYCDANEVMINALESVGIDYMEVREPEGYHPEDIPEELEEIRDFIDEMMNDAWDLSKEHKFMN